MKTKTFENIFGRKAKLGELYTVFYKGLDGVHMTEMVISDNDRDVVSVETSSNYIEWMSDKPLIPGSK